MVRERKFRAVGSIDGHMVVAASVLRIRAEEWDCPITGDERGVSLSLWGCDLRLRSRGRLIRVEITGPEDRLVGALRDSATSIFAESGLTVDWDRVDEGALAPGLSLLRVEGVREVTPNFLRVRLRGREASRFGTGSLHFRLLLPRKGRQPVWPRVAKTGRTVWPVGEDSLHRPVYTVAAQGDDWLDFDIFRHADSPTCDWAEDSPAGQVVGVMGPGGGWCPTAQRLWLFGDETALPAMSRIMALAGGRARAMVRCAASDLPALSGSGRVTRCDDLLDAVHAHTDLAEGSYLWFAASDRQARAARAHLQASGVPKNRFTAAAYWS